MIAVQEFTLTVAELSKRLGMNLEDPHALCGLKDRYRALLKDNIANPSSGPSGMDVGESSKAVLSAIKEGYDPIGDMIRTATGPSAATDAREAAVQKLLRIKQLPGSRLG